MTDLINQKVTLLDAAKRHWRSFAPIWIFPFWFMFGGLAADKTRHPNLIFILVFAPLFFWSFFRGRAYGCGGRYNTATIVFWLLWCQC